MNNDSNKKPVYWPDALIELLSEATSPYTDEVFFKTLMQTMATAFQVRHAFITECIGEPPTRVRMLAFWSDGHFEDPLEYDLEGTPCDETINCGRLVLHKEQLGALFPKEKGFAESYIGVPVFDAEKSRVIGHIAFLDDAPFQDQGLTRASFEQFTSRASAEIQRLQTDRKLRNSEYHNRLYSIGEMASGLAHELNQPLTVILSFTNAVQRMLLAKQEKDPEVVEALERIVSNTERAGKIIRDMRELFKKDPARKTPTDINQQVREVLQLIDQDIQHAQVSVELQLQQDLPAIKANPMQLQQVFAHLIRNAIEALDYNPVKQRKILISSQIQASDQANGGAKNVVEINVQDNGPGLPREIEENLFYQSTTPKEQKMGLGLAICESLVQLHGGKIRGSNRGLLHNNTRGASFQVILPTKEEGNYSR